MKYLTFEIHPKQRLGYQQLIKEKNIKQIFDLVRSGKCASRAELVRTMHLSATAVSALVEELLEEKLLVESGPTQTTYPGRRPMQLCLNAESRQIAVFSLSRKGVQYTLFDLGCRVIESFFIDHPADDFYVRDTGDEYARLFEDVLLNRSRHFDRSKTVVIGVSFPGIFLEEEQAFSVQAAMNVSFSEISMRRLEERLGIQLFMGNVSMCLAYAEKKYIEVASDDEGEIRDLIYINICDGLGAGIVSEGTIMTGPFNTAGEVGHISVNPHGDLCKCGSRGCLEQYVTQNAILKRLQDACEKAGKPAPKDLSEVKGIAERVPETRAVLDDIAEELAVGIYSMICVTGIGRVIVGGCAEILGEGFLERLRFSIHRRSLLAGRAILDYGHEEAGGDSAGMAHYFLDKAYTITLTDQKEKH